MGREHVHLIGIGGTGMTALAGLLHESGCRVTGSDGRLYPPTSTILEEMGLQVHEGFDAAWLDPAPDLVVIGNAVSRGNPEVERTLDGSLEFTSMAGILSSRFLRNRHSIVVAGTHGKTTTTSMLAWVLTQAGRDPGFLIGGLPQNFENPFHVGTGEAFVIEGDEYDTAFFDKGPKFMHYRPDTLLIGTVEFDHADIYRDLDDVERAFRRLVNIVPGRGLIIRHEDDEVTRRVTADARSRVQGYGFEHGEWRAADFRETERGSRFRVLREGRPFLEASVRWVGEHNVRNALAVVGAAAEQGLGAAEVAAGLESFRGVRRRLELRGEVEGIKVLDDFAHHPTAIDATLRAVRRSHPRGRVWAVLEPRSWSMRHDVFQDRLSRAFSAADQVVLADVFRSDSVPPDRRLSPEHVVEAIAASGKPARFIETTGEIVDLLSDELKTDDVVVVMSNGSFEGLHDRLLDALRTRVGSVQGS